MNRTPSLPVAALATLLAAWSGGCALLSTGGEPPAQPVPVSPADASDVVANARTRFEWRPVDGALWYDFHVFDASARGIVSEVRGLLPADVCDATGRCAINVAPRLPAASGHAWRVRATNGYGASGWTRTPFAVSR